MKEVNVEILDGFVHGALDAKRGQRLTLRYDVATALEARGLVKILVKPKVAPLAVQSVSGVPSAGKTPAAGSTLSSSSLPAAPASRKTTSASSAPGAKRPRKKKEAPGA